MRAATSRRRSDTRSSSSARSRTIESPATGARERREFGELTLEIDRTLCVGFGDCIAQAPELFELDEEGIVRVRADATEAVRERLILACDVCPVDALTLFENGIRIVPGSGT